MLRRFRRVATFVATAAVLASANPSIAGSIRGASGAPGPSLAIRDLGRAPQMQRISVTLVLKYRHADELEKLIALQSDPGSRIYHKFLSNAQFDAYFAPSTGDYARTALALQREGFTISRVYPNRTLIGASAPVAAVERFFHTQIHRVGQAGAGVRYANLTPPVLALDTLAAASLSNVVHVRPAYAFGRADAARRVAAETSVDAVQDGGFESGGYAYWQQQCPQAASSLPGTITSTSPHGGTKDAFLGVTGGYQYAGPSYICQLLTVPKNATLSFWASKTAVPGTNAANSYQTATLVDPFGFPLQTFYTTATTSGGYRLQTFPVAPSLAGRQAMLSFGTYNDGSPDYVNQRVDDVALTGEYVPTPTPAPTQKPTPTPHPTATATGTERPTPTPVPTATARPTPTPVRTATPKPTPAPTGTVAGALYGPDGGYGPIAVANGYDLPVQHGYNGAGRSTGIEIDADFANSDLATYLNYFHIKRSGTVTRETVDGGPAGQSSDSIETTLDVETIAANAPGANVIVYEIPDLSDQSIEDGYNQEVSDDTVDVVNSSFGGCETGDPSFATATNQIAQQGAAKGITFSASSGDQGSNCQGGSLSTEIPAVDPYFTGDGGTTLQVNSNGTYRSETAWSGSGGGVSTIFSLPSYQKGVAGLASSTKRNVPDVAFAADPNSGTSFYYQGYWQGPLGGTSWASPIFCALLTEIDQRTNSRAGFVNPALYQTYASDGYRAFHDVTSGNNGSYSAHTGYDDVTGIGSGRGYYLSGAL